MKLRRFFEARPGRPYGMLDPIICVSCGFPLAEAARILRKVRAKCAARGEPDRPLGDVLTSLRVDLPCCRTHLLTNRRLEDAAGQPGP